MHKLQGSASRLLIAITAVFSIAFSAFGEIPISDPATARGASRQSSPVSATDGRDFLLVWTDMRSGRPAIYATRVAEDGEVLDPEGILISDAGENAYAPSVAWTGSSYIVVWQQENGCRFRRIARDGVVDDHAGRVLDGGCRRARIAAVDGMTIVTAALYYGDIQVEVIESTGTVRKIDLAYGEQPDIACTRSECWLVWDSYGLVSGRRLGRRGERLSSDRILALRSAGPVIAAAGDRFLLAWRERFNPGWPSQRIWAQELDAESVLGADSKFKPFLITETKKPVIVDTTVSPSGRGFIVAWSQEHEKTPIDRRPGFQTDYVPYPLPPPSQAQMEIRAQRVGDGVEEQLTLAQSDVGRYDRPSVTSNGVTHLVAWIEQHSGKITAGLSSAGTSFSRIPVTRTATAQSEPHIVACEDHLLVVWAEELNGDGTHSILARRFRFSGEALDVRPIMIASASESQHRPVAAFDGHSYLVAWRQGSRMYARRLHRDGTLAPDILALAENLLYEPLVVVGTDRGFAMLQADGRRLMLTRIGTEPPIERTPIADSHGRYALAWTGSELVVVWSEHGRVHAQRLSSTGAPLGAQILVGFGVHATSISIACGPSDCVAAWGESLDGVKVASIANGTAYLIGEPIPDPPYYRTQSTDRFQPTVVRTDGGFKVISYGPDGALYERPVRDGVTLSESVLSEPRIEKEDYAIASTPQGLATVYSRSVLGPGYAGARRLFLRHQP